MLYPSNEGERSRVQSRGLQLADSFSTDTKPSNPKKKAHNIQIPGLFDGLGSAWVTDSGPIHLPRLVTSCPIQQLYLSGLETRLIRAGPDLREYH